jgi:hypothetical protein
MNLRCKCKPEHSCPGGCSGFNGAVVIIKRHLVVAGAGGFLAMRKLRLYLPGLKSFAMLTGIT